MVMDIRSRVFLLVNAAATALLIIFVPGNTVSYTAETNGWAAAVGGRNRPQARTSVCDGVSAESAESLQPRLQVNQEHDAQIEAAAFSPTHDVYATAGADGTARIWNASTHRLLRVFVGRDRLRSLAFSSDGCLLASAGGFESQAERRGSGHVWSVEKGVEVFRIDYHSPILSIAISRDRKTVLVGSQNGDAVLWSLETRTELWRYSMYEGEGLTVSRGGIDTVEFSPDGRYALTIGDRLHVWSIAALPWRPFRVSEGKTAKAVFNPRGTPLVVTAGSDPYDSSGGSDIAVSANGDVFAQSSKGRIDGFQPDSSRPIFSLDRERTGVSPPIALSPDGRRLLATDGGSRAILVDIKSDARPQTSAIAGVAPGNLVLSDDGQLLLFGRSDGRFDLWSIRESRQLGSLTPTGAVTALAISPNRQYVLASTSAKATLWSVDTQKALWSVPFSAARFLQFSPNASLCAIGDLNRLEVRRTKDGGLVTSFENEVPHQEGVLFSASDKSVLIASGPIVVMRSLATKAVQLRFGPSEEEMRWTAGLQRAGYVQGGNLYVAGAPATEDNRISLPPGIGDLPDGLVSHSLGRLSVIGATGVQTFRWPVPSGHSEPVLSMALAGESLLTGSEEGTAILWSVRSGKLVSRLEGHSGYVTAVALSKDGRRALTGGDTSVRIWSIRDSVTSLERVLQTTGFVRAATLTDNDELAVAVTSDRTLWIWNTDDGRELARLVFSGKGVWVVAEPEGRFDSNQVGDNSALHWIMPDDPLRALASDIFMRDYYEPRLLPRILAGEPLPAVRPLASLNRVQPMVEIESVTWADAAAGQASLTVKVARALDEFVRGGRPTTVTTDVYDLRVFRDGQLVGRAPQWSVEWQDRRPAAEDVEIGLTEWRAQTHIALKPDGTAHLTFPVQVPRRSDMQEVTFTAYGFNEDRVKSATAARTVPVPKVTPRRGTAYVIGVGVNRTESSPSWDLQYAVNDARSLVKTVHARLRAGRQFADVVPIRLVSDHKPPEPLDGPATKAHLRTVLDRLAGRPVDAARLRPIPQAERLARAQPEDVVVLAVSSHGYTDARGIFHFVLSDIGPDQTADVTPALQARTLSSDELSAWLRDVDAGELVLIVDACHSESTVNTDGFKPGPMGSRGLGQLAYDKGMRVLAASKAREAAIERGGRVRQGLLTYALVRQGLEQGAADFQPQDGEIDLREWLAYAVQAVPRLFAEGDARGSITTPIGPGGGTRDGFQGRRRTVPRYQQPVLFDFGRRENSFRVSLLGVR